MTDDLEAIEQRARRAKVRTGQCQTCFHGLHQNVCHVSVYGQECRCLPSAAADPAYVSVCDDALALVQRVRELEAENERLRGTNAKPLPVDVVEADCSGPGRRWFEYSVEFGFDGYFSRREGRAEAIAEAVARLRATATATEELLKDPTP